MHLCFLHTWVRIPSFVLFIFSFVLGFHKRLNSRLNNKAYVAKVKLYSFFRKDIWGQLRWKRDLKYKKAVYNIMKYKRRFFKIMLYQIHKGIRFKKKKYRPSHYAYFHHRIIRLYYSSIKKRFFGKLGRVIKRKTGLLVNRFFSLLERRLDVITVKSFYFDSIFLSKRFIINRNVFVNTIRLNNPRYIVKVGDIISFPKKPFYFGFFRIWRRFFSSSDFSYFHRHFFKAFVILNATRKLGQRTKTNRFYRIFFFFSRFNLFFDVRRCHTVGFFDFIVFFIERVIFFQSSFTVQQFILFFLSFFFRFRRKISLYYKFLFVYSEYYRYAWARKRRSWLFEKFLRRRKKYIMKQLINYRWRRKYETKKIFYKKFLLNSHLVFPLKKHYYKIGISRRMYRFINRKAENLLFFAGLPPYLEVNLKVHKIILVKEPTMKSVRYPFSTNYLRNFMFFQYYRKQSYF